MSRPNETSMLHWVDELLATGHCAFTPEIWQREHPEHSDIAVKRALSRMSANGKVVSLHKGYYLIIPPQHSHKGMLPPPLFLDAFMQHLQRPYYLALLNAAAFHGASHQQPQEYFVMTDFPVLRPTLKKGVKINYISIKEIPPSLIETRTTEAGYLRISNAALTAADVIQFEKRVGGLNRASVVLRELAEVLQPADFNATFLHHVHGTTLQRLGYLLEKVCGCDALADALFEGMKRECFRLFRIPLKTAISAKSYTSGNRWNVVVNLEIDPDP